MGRIIAEYGVKKLVFIGKTAQTIADEVALGGLKGDIYVFPDMNGVGELLLKNVRQDTIVLIKGSMFDYDLRRLVDCLRA